MPDLPWHERPNAPAPGTALCRLEAVPDGQGREFAFGAGWRAFRMFVVRRGNRVWGYVNVCPHFQLPLNNQHRPDNFVTRDGRLIKCSQHLAVFRFEDGYCVDGACPGERLTPVAVEVREATVVVGQLVQAQRCDADG